MTSSPVAVIGSTGLVGSNVLSTLLELKTLVPIHTISRREPKTKSPDLNAIINADTNQWATTLTSIAPLPTTVVSALGTTRAAAGGIANQWKVDHDLNVELAKAAKEAGIKNFVFVSGAGTRGIISKFLPYSKMKIGVEDTIQELDFDHSVILRPGAILGAREQARGAEVAFQGLMKRTPAKVQDALGQDAEVIARAAVRAMQLVQEGKAPSKHWVVESSEILKLGRDEWDTKGASTA